MSGLISNALAATTEATHTAANAAAAAPSMMGNMLMIGAFIAIFYFLIIRPQSKRMKEHRQLLSNLNKDDEIVTNGGILGKIVKISDDFITISVSEGVQIPLQKAAIAAVLPKGTLKSI